jgi:hypothetical protein
VRLRAGNRPFFAARRSAYRACAAALAVPNSANTDLDSRLTKHHTLQAAVRDHLVARRKSVPRLALWAQIRGRSRKIAIRIENAAQTSSQRENEVNNYILPMTD